MADIGDQELVIGLKTNDQFCQRLLVDRYAGRLLSIVLKLGLSHQDAEEVINDSLYKIIQNINKFELTRGTKFSAWVARIAINTARDKIKQIKDPPVSQSVDERAERGIQDTKALWQKQAQSGSEVGKLTQKIMLQALECLSEIDQDILRCCACGFQQKEVAALLNKTPSAVKIGHSRAKKRLKQKYIDIVESFKDRRTGMAIKDFLGIEAANEKTAN